jgi:hypothetical protein
VKNKTTSIMKAKLATPILIACALFMTITAGTGLFEHLFGIPKMLSSPSAMETVYANNSDQPVRFWIPLHGAILITLILSLVFNWRNPDRKKFVLLTFLLYVYISVVSIWFANQLFQFRALDDTAEFYQRTKQWIILSWHRPIIGVISAVLLMVAISKPGAKTVTAA